MMLAIDLSADLHDDDPAVPTPVPTPLSQEGRMVKAGIDRYMRRQDKLAEQGAAYERDDISSVIRRFLLDVANAVETLVQDNQAIKNPRNRAQALVKLETIDPTVVSYLALSISLSSISKGEDNSSRENVANHLASAIETEINFRHIAEDNPKLWKRLERYSQERGSQQHKIRFIKNTAAKEGYEPEPWPRDVSMRLGIILLDLLSTHGVIVMESKGEGTKKERVLVGPSEEVLKWLDEHKTKALAGALPLVRPVLAPMTSPPVSWTSAYGGGYNTLKYSLLKRTRRPNRSGVSQPVLDAINVIQATPWRINQTMLTIVTSLWSAQSAVGKLPSGTQIPKPPRVDDTAYAEMTGDQKKEMRLNLRYIHKRNRQAYSDDISLGMTIAQAQELGDAVFYIPYDLDFRGRVYAKPLINPQGPDYIRSLFEFAEGTRITERGFMWLAIQCATLWDGPEKLSKQSFDDRYNWAIQEDTLEFLKEIVADPLGDGRWHQADKPFMFLRTAIDLVGSLRDDAYVSCVPVSLDGSCSGIQHFSAILRDERGGASVNLLPSETPADVYGDVAKRVVAKLESDIGNETWSTQDVLLHADGAAWWLDHGVDRKVVKKPVMTYGYSSRLPGFTDWYESEYVRPAFDRAGKASGANATARYLARHTLAAVEDQLVAVAGGMQWLCDLTAVMAHEGLPVTWTTPSGLTVTQDCRTKKSRILDIRSTGKHIRFTLADDTETIDKKKQGQSIAPNFIHSMDAAHLVLTVLRASGAYATKVTNFSLIHDSFGTTAADVDVMFCAVREAFVAMYTLHDPFEALYQSACASLSDKGKEKLRRPPAKGNLDIEQVCQSLYAFA